MSRASRQKAYPCIFPSLASGSGKRRFASAFALFMVGTFLVDASAADSPQGNRAKWTTYRAALKESKATGRPIMLVYSGSDWCHWCRRLSTEVFQTKTFVEWSANKVIPVEVDFPQSYQLPAHLAQQNQFLASKFAPYVNSYPTVLFLNSSEQVIGSLGFVEGGPNPWIAMAQIHVSPDDKIAISTVPSAK